MLIGELADHTGVTTKTLRFYERQGLGEILAIRDRGEAPCEHVSTLVEQRLAEVEQRLAELRAVRTQLRDIAARSVELDPGDCDGYCGLIPSRLVADDPPQHEHQPGPKTRTGAAVRPEQTLSHSAGPGFDGREGAAELLGIPIGAVMSRLHRARRRLRDALERAGRFVEVRHR